MFDSGGLGNSESQTSNYDQSTAYGATDQGTGAQTGAKLLLGNAQGATISVSDPLAVQLARELGLSAINNSGMAASAANSLARQAMEESSNLKKLTLEGGADKAVTAFKWAAGIFGLWLLLGYKKKKAAA